MIDKKVSNKEFPDKKSYNDFLELILEIDRIHHENKGKVSVSEFQLRLELRLRINIKGLVLKVLKVKKFLLNKGSEFLHWIFGSPDP